MKKAILLCLLLVGCDAFTNVDDARRALEAEGFKNIEVTGYKWMACAKDDTYHTGFRAVNREGRTVTGTVCSGVWFKNATIRY